MHMQTCFRKKENRRACQCGERLICREYTKIHDSSRYMVGIVVSNRLLARSVLGLRLCFLGRRLLSCPKVKEEHTYARSLFAGGGPSGPSPRTKTWPCKGIWPPYVLGWLSHPYLTEETVKPSVPGPKPRDRWHGNMLLGRVRGPMK